MFKVKPISQGAMIGLFIFAVFFIVFPSYSQTIISSIEITDIDYQQFPVISAKVRILSDTRTPVTDISSEDLAVTEDGQAVDFNHQPIKTGIKTVVVLDLGMGIDHKGLSDEIQFSEMKHAAGSFINTLGEDDGLELITVRGDDTEVFVSLTNDQTKLQESLEALGIGDLSTLTNGLDGLKYALDDLQKATGDNTPCAVILITSGIQSTYRGDRTSYSAIESQAETFDIPIHTILVGDNQETQSLESLVAESGGRFIRYRSNEAPNPILNWLDAQRLQYLITYRTKSSSTDERELKVSAQTESGSQYDVQKFRLSPSPKPPEIVSLTINNGDPVIRKAPEHDSDLTNIPLTEVQIDANFQWPDGYTNRSIARAELLIDGQPHDEPLFDLAGESISFTWDLRTYTNEGKTTARVQVVLTDELGFQSSEEVQVPVEVFVPEIGGPGICDSLNEFPYVGTSLYDACEKWGITPAQMLNMVIALAALIMVAIIWFKRDTVVAVGKEVGTRVTETVRRVTQRIGGGRSKPKAYLEAVRGLPEEELKTYDIFGETPIGRNPRYAELVFENPKISGLHCTLHLDGNSWTIEDSDSSNGTYLNSKRLSPFQHAELNDGDTVELAPVERGGIRFNFTLAEDFSFDDDYGYEDWEEESDVEILEPQPSTRITDRVKTTPVDHHDIEGDDDGEFDPSAQEF